MTTSQPRPRRAARIAGAALMSTALSPADLAALKTEIETDPQTYGYGPHITAGEPELIAEKLNQVRDGTDGEAAITIRRADISAQEVLEAIDNRDFVATPDAAHVAWFQSVTQQAAIRLINLDGTDTRVLGNLRRLLQNPGPQGSRDRLNGIANRFGSRAEQLFGPDTFITIQDVAAALQS